MCMDCLIVCISAEKTPAHISWSIPVFFVISRDWTITKYKAIVINIEGNGILVCIWCTNSKTHCVSMLHSTWDMSNISWRQCKVWCLCSLLDSTGCGVFDSLLVRLWNSCDAFSWYRWYFCSESIHEIILEFSVWIVLAN
jgi:hypothetical protein